MAGRPTSCGRERAAAAAELATGKSHHRTFSPPPAPAAAPSKKRNVYPDADAAIAAAAHQSGGSFAGAWVYRDANGSEVFRVIRYALPDGEKQYRPIHQAKDGWRIGDPSGPLPLYRLNDLPATGTVWVTEGEKAADAARDIGLVATTSAHGAGSAEKTDWTPLAGRQVYILPDHDESGRKYAQDVARLLVKLTPPAVEKIIALPGLPAKGDIAEFIHARAGISANAICGEVEALAAKTAHLNAADLIGGPVLTCMADVESSEISWLWPGRVALGDLRCWRATPGRVRAS
jgi:hypothetical protein